MDNNQLPEDWLSAYYDGELSDEQIKEAEARLESSSDARRDLGELTQLSKLLADLPQEKAPSELATNVASFVNNSKSTVQPKQKTENRSKKSLLGLLYISGTLASAALVMIAIFYTNNAPEEIPLIRSEFHLENGLAQHDKNSDKLDEDTLHEGPRVAVKTPQDDFGLTDSDRSEKGGLPGNSMSTLTLANKTKNADVLSSRMYVNLNQTGKVKLAYLGDEMKETVLSIEAKKETPAPSKSSVSWEDVLSELETQGDDVATVVLTCSDAKTANYGVQKLLISNSIHQLPHSNLDSNTSLDSIADNQKEKWNFFYLETENTADTKALEESLRERRKLSVIKQKTKRQKEDSLETKDYSTLQFYTRFAKKGKPSRSEAILQGNGAAIYLEAEPVELLNSLQLIENQKAIQQIVINGRTNLKRNELSNNGTNLEVIYQNNRPHLNTAGTKMLFSDSVVNAPQPRKIERKGDGKAPVQKSKSSEDEKKPNEFLSKSTSPKPSKPNRSARASTSFEKNQSRNTSNFGTNTFRRGDEYRFDTNTIMRNGFQTPVDLPIVKTEEIIKKKPDSSAIEFKKLSKSRLAEPKPTRGLKSKFKEESYGVPQPRKEDEKKKRKLKEVELSKKVDSITKRYRVLFVFKEEKETPQIEGVTKQSTPLETKTAPKKSESK